MVEGLLGTCSSRTAIQRRGWAQLHLPRDAPPHDSRSHDFVKAVRSQGATCPACMGLPHRCPPPIGLVWSYSRELQGADQDAPDSGPLGTTDVELQLSVASFDNTTVCSKKRREEVTFDLVSTEDPMWVKTILPPAGGITRPWPHQCSRLPCLKR
jgi:hypothetical protein